MIKKQLLVKVYSKVMKITNVLFGKKPNGILAFDIYDPESTFKDIPNVYVKTFSENYAVENFNFIHLEGEQFDIICPFNANSIIVYIDAKNSFFRFSNNLLISPKLQAVLPNRPETSNIVLLTKSKLNYKVKKLSGTIAYLSNTWVNNYYHWLIFTLPLLSVYSKFINLGNIDYFYIGETKLSSFQRSTLSMAGIPERKLITKACSGDRFLMAYSINEKSANDKIYRSYHDYLFTKNLIQPFISVDTDKNISRIYVKRGSVKNRKVENEEAVMTYLSAFGFIALSMDEHTVAQQASIFQNANIIIGLHGAALTNTIFCKPATILIEMFPENYCDISYFTISCFAALKYFYFKCKEQSGNVTVDIRKLEQICRIAKIA